MPKSLDELSHAENWLNLRLQRQKSRINNFFGKNAVLSIIGLSYRAAPMMKKVAKTIEKRLNGMRHGVSNGNEESMNNKIRMLRIKARQYCNRERFKPREILHYEKLNMLF